MTVVQSTQQPWWVNAHERPEWFFELEKAFVEAGLCDWSSVSKPHPQDYALVAAHFYTSLEGSRDD